MAANSLHTMPHRWPGALLLTTAAWVATTGGVAAAEPTACQQTASPACLVAFEAPGLGGRLNYYASLTPGAASTPEPTAALVVMHGHPRDANKSFDAALLAASRAEAVNDTVVIAPIFQVDADQAKRCQTAGVPVARDGDLLWTCASWLDGRPAANGNQPTSFAAMDALLAELTRQWPSLRSITVAGFSAGAQMVQHYIGFAAWPVSGTVSVRYVVADPGTWLYFDAERPEPIAPGCDAVNRWKYGTDDLPATVGLSAAAARARYAQADIHYLGGELDSSAAAGTYYKILDKSCAAMAQGPYRRQRGEAYAAYDRRLLAPDKQRQLTVVPGCAHDVACVFPAAGARAALFGLGR